MSKNIDERIVEMRFDNKQFESGIQTSVKSLDNLKQGLKLEEASKGLSNLELAGKRFSLAGIAESVDYISSKFTAMGIIGITALQNLTNSAINAGKTIISSLTVDPVKMGLNEYETKMNSITTIMTNTASKGTTLKQVNDTLNELNKYADQTIYNFAEMTRNIGTFTAAGIDLKTSATAIKGIANLAAGSGSNAEQASTAMYQLSQALAAGKVGLQDWNSVVNAGMGGQLFQTALEKTAKQLGKGRDMSVSFRESLQDGWITTKVLTKTLEKFASDPSLLKAATQVKTFTQLLDTMKESVQSGWAQSWENIIGDREEAAQVFTAVNNAFGEMSGASADARNEMLAFWKANGGRAAVIEGISNAFKALQAILKPISEAFREVFPAMTGQRLVEISTKFRDLTAKFKIGAESIENIKITFKGFFAVLDIGVKVFKLIAGGIGMLIGALIPGSGSLLSMTAALGNLFIRLNDAIEKSGIMTTIVSKMGTAFTLLKDVIKDIVNNSLTKLEPKIIIIKDALIKLWDSFTKLFRGTTVFAEGLNETDDALSTTEKHAINLKDTFTKLVGFLTAVKNAIVTVAKAIKSFLTPVFESIKKKFDEFTLQDFGALLTGGGLLMFAKTLSKGLSSVDGILENFSGILSQVGDTLKAFQLKVKAQALLTIAIALGVLAASLFVLAQIDGGSLAKSLGALTLVFAELIGGLILINKFVGDIKKVTGQMIALGIGMLLLAYSVKTLSSIDADKLSQGIKALAALMGVIAIFVQITRGGDLKKSAGGLIAFSIGLNILVGALAILGKLDPARLEQGTKAIANLMGMIALFVMVTKEGDLRKSAGGLTAFSVGLLILTGALAILGNLDVAKLEQGTKALMDLMMGIGLFVMLTKEGDLKKSAGGLMGFAAGIMILVGSLSILANLEPAKLEQGMKAIANLVAGIALFIMVTNKGDLKQSAGGLIGFSIGILILTKALTTLGELDPVALEQGSKAIAAMMTAIALFINLTSKGDLKSSATGLIGFAVGLTVLTGAVAILAAINPDKIVQGVASLVVLMTAIGAFINLTKEGDLKASAAGLIGFSTGLMILAGVIALLSALNTEKLIMASVAISTLITAIAMFVNVSKGTDLAKTAIGLIAFSAGIAILAGALVIVSQLDTVKIVSAGAALTALMIGIIAFVKLTNGINLLTSAVGLIIFAGALTVLAKVITTLGSTDINTLIIGVGALAVSLTLLGLTAFILAPLTPVMLGLSAAIVLFGIGCLAVGAGMLAFATGLNILAVSGTAGAVALTFAVQSIIALIPLALTTLALGLIAFAKTLGDNAPIITSAFMNVINAIIDTAVIMIPKMVESGFKLIMGILTGISNNIGKVVAAGIDVIVQFINGVSSKIGDITDAAFRVFISFVNGLSNAIRNNHDAIYAACRNLINALIEVIVDLVPNMIEVGKDVMRGFIKGITNMDGSLRQAMNGIVNGAVDGVKKLLGIHSPSRVFGEIGRFSVEGFAVGLNKFGGMAVKAASSVGTKAMNSITSAVSGISDLIGGDMNLNPTIRPIMDLSNIQNGDKQLYGMMNKYDGYSVAGSIDLANTTAKGMNASRNTDTSSVGETLTPQTSISQQNTFNITSNNPKEVANEVSRILQKQVERRDAAWA